VAGAFRGQTQSGGAFAQAQSPSDRLRERDYLEKIPPTVVPGRTTTEETNKLWQDYAQPRVDVLRFLGIPGYEAWDIIGEMPDVKDAKKKAYEGNVPPPDFEDLLRR
jgi:hypothetical protein